MKVLTKQLISAANDSAFRILKNMIIYWRKKDEFYKCYYYIGTPDVFVDNIQIVDKCVNLAAQNMCLHRHG